MGTFLINKLAGVFRILYLFVVLTAILEMGVATLYYMGLNNLFLFHIHTYLEFCLFSLIYIRLSSSTATKKVILSIVPAFLIYSFITLIFVEDANGFNSLQRNIEGLLLSIFAFVHLFELKRRKLKNPTVLLSVSLISYFTINIFLFVSARNMFLNGDDYNWNIHGLSNILLNVCFALVLIQDYRLNAKDKI